MHSSQPFGSTFRLTLYQIRIIVHAIEIRCDFQVNLINFGFFEKFSIHFFLSNFISIFTYFANCSKKYFSTINSILSRLFNGPPKVVNAAPLMFLRVAATTAVAAFDSSSDRAPSHLSLRCTAVASPLSRQNINKKCARAGRECVAPTRTKRKSW